MKRTTIVYSESDGSICIHDIQNAATQYDLEKYFKARNCDRNAWRAYLMGNNLREDGVDVAYSYDDIVNRIKIEYIEGESPESYSFVQKGTIMKKDKFEEIIQDLKKAGERLKKIVLIYTENTKEVKI
jgi:hypothetical protein